MKRAFVTGATGFVGASVVRELLADGWEVRALVRSNSNRSNIAGLPLEQLEGDLTDRAHLTELIDGCEAVFHIAAHYSLWARDGDLLYRVNVEGTKNLLAAARRAQVRRFVHTSSVAAIGVPQPGCTADEAFDSRIEDLTGDYKKSKFLAEAAAREAARGGLDVVIVNPSTPVGPYDIKPTPTGEIIVRFLEGRMPFYVHTGLNLIAVEDVARGHLLAYERGQTGERYILGNRNLTLREILEILAVITGRRAPRFAIPHFIPLFAAYLDEVVLAHTIGKQPKLSVAAVRMSRRAMYYDSSRAVRELGLPQSPVEDALARAAEWFRKK
ncbi:MAG: NAD-dependent epimerase/dehydratase family protein [Blastocatellales bacterium]|nr:NAD-dependent epimerase/dehydratase family protein [Blastocatellales bacterium]